MEWHIKLNDIKGDMSSDVATKVETALREAIGALPEELDIKVKIKSKKIEDETN